MYVIVYLSGCRSQENSCDNINNINIPRVSVANFGQMFADFSFLSVSNLLPTQIQQISSVYLNVDGS